MFAIGSDLRTWQEDDKLPDVGVWAYVWRLEIGKQMLKISH